MLLNDDERTRAEAKADQIQRLLAEESMSVALAALGMATSAAMDQVAPQVMESWLARVRTVRKATDRLPAESVH